MTIRTWLFLGMALACALPASPVQGTPAGIRVGGEPSLTPRAAASLRWRAATFPPAAAAEQRYGTLPLQKLLELERYNAGRQMKPMRIGVARHAANESVDEALPPLRWNRTPDGGLVTRLVFSSPDAMALRVGLQVIDLPARAELRFAGSLGDSRVAAMITGGEIARLLDDKRIFWTPGTDGDTQTVEVYLPRGVDSGRVALRAPQLSHLLANSLDDFKIMKNIGSSGACNIDAACKVGQFGSDYVKAKNAVAHLVFVSAGSTYVCTGTLLADTDASTQTPYFYSAHHCIEDQTVASTVSTYWGREAPTCGGTGALGTQLVGGATHLYSDAATDALLLQLNRAAPAGAYFVGWDTSLLPSGRGVIGIHHPQGDSKKVSVGQQLSRDQSRVTVGWTEGTTEGGSSGSAIFSADFNGYHVRGGLYGGSASCANSGSLANAQNRDLYSRFDVVFPSIAGFLARVTAQPVHANGSQPMVRTRTSSVPAPASSAPTPVRARRPVPASRRPSGPLEP